MSIDETPQSRTPHDPPASPDAANAPAEGDAREPVGFREETPEPAAPEASVAARRADEPTEDSHSPLVLVIEDEAPVANSLAEILRARGCRVTVAADGRAGLAAFRTRTPDAVFCDLLLPGRNGFRLAEDFREMAPHVPLIIMTGVYRSESYRQDLAHARLFLGKPFDAAELEEAVALAAGSRASRQAQTDAKPARAARRSEPWIPTALLPLPKLLQVLAADKRTGLLTHRVGERRTVFQIESGQVRFVRTNDPALRLGAVLSQLGTITPDDLAAATVDLESRSEPARLGDVLLERGLLTPEELRRGLQLQLRRVIAGAFTEEDGETLFREEVAQEGESVQLEADVRALIVAGCSSWRDSEDHLLGHLPDASCRVLLAADPTDAALALPPVLRQLTAALHEPTALGDVVSMAELVGLRGRATAFGLLCSGVIKVDAADSAWSPHQTARTDERRMIPSELHPLAALLALEDEKATGVLRVRVGETVIGLGLRGGALCSASSSDERSRIGHRLVDAGRITPEELELALAAQRERRGQPVGRLLVELGVLDPAGLLQAVRAHVLAIARELALAPTWDLATFTDGRLPETEPVPLGVTLSDVVLDALRATPVRRLERLAGQLATDRPLLSTEALGSGRFSFSETEELVRASLGEDSRALLAAVAHADRSDPEILRVACLALLVTPAETADTADHAAAEQATAPAGSREPVGAASPQA